MHARDDGQRNHHLRRLGQSDLFARRVVSLKSRLTDTGRDIAVHELLFSAGIVQHMLEVLRVERYSVDCATVGQPQRAGRRGHDCAGVSVGVGATRGRQAAALQYREHGRKHIELLNSEANKLHSSVHMRVRCNKNNPKALTARPDFISTLPFDGLRVCITHRIHHAHGESGIRVGFRLMSAAFSSLRS